MVNWVVSAVARRVELWDDTLVVPPPLAARAAVFAFGDELLDLARHNGWSWCTPAGRTLAAAKLLPMAEAALLPELQRLAANARNARSGVSAGAPS